MRASRLLPGDEAGPPGGAGAPRTAVRWRVTWLLFACTAVMYLVRTVTSTTALDMRDELGWSTVQKGLFLSSFYFGYITMQIPGGLLARRYGGKAVLLAGTLWPMLATLATPAAARHASFGALLAVRVAMGVGESVTYPAIVEVLSRWSTPAERARQSTVAYAGGTVGTLGALLLSPLLARRWGWPAPYYVFAALGLAWCVAWQALAKSVPAAHPGVSRAEMRLFPAAGAAAAGGAGAPLLPPWRVWRGLLRSPNVWAAISANFTTNWSLYVLLSYIPSYFRDTWGVETDDALATGLLSAAPFAAMSLAAPLGSVLADWMRKRGVPRARVSFGFQAATYAGSSCFMVLLAYAARSKGGAEALLSIAVAFLALHSCGFVAHVVGVGGRHAATIISLSNTAGTLPGIIGVNAAAAVLDRTDNDYSYVFMMAVGVNALGLAAWSLLFRPGPVRVDDGRADGGGGRSNVDEEDDDDEKERDETRLLPHGAGGVELHARGGGPPQDSASGSELAPFPANPFDGGGEGGAYSDLFPAVAMDGTS